MLFMTFLGLNVHKMKLRRDRFAILAFNILIGTASRAILRAVGMETAQNASVILENLVARRTPV